MRKLTLLTILGLLGAGGSARADFAFLSAEPPIVPASARAAAAPLDIRPAAALDEPPAQPDARRKTTRLRAPLVAHGFGDQVPLSFAVRQIVPRSIKVTFGPGADDTALVDWRGGKQWRLVLGEAIAPLGLRLSLQAQSLTIHR